MHYKNISELKVGDRVLVKCNLRDLPLEERKAGMGYGAGNKPISWQNYWSQSCTDTIGKEYTVISIHLWCGISMKELGGLRLPLCVLVPACPLHDLNKSVLEAIKVVKLLIKDLS
jgi:hypothetical protein